MGRFLRFSVLAVLLACLPGCSEAPSRPSVISDPAGNAPKASARYIQAPWDVSLPGVAGAATAATAGTLTGTFVNSNGFAGTLTGTLDNGTFTGSLTTITPSGCHAERQFTGPLTAQTLNWSPGPQINDCGGASPLTVAIEAPAAPPSASPCTYAAALSSTSVPGTGGSVTVTVTAGAGCDWFATSSDSFVTLSAARGTADGTVQFTFAANPSGMPRTALLVVAAQSFEITQAGGPAPVCTYGLNDTGRTFDATGALGGVDMRVSGGCAWTAVSDAPWLTITSGSTGSGDRAINFAVAANPGLSQRVGTITAAGLKFTVTQNGISCTYTVTPPATTAFPTAGGTGSVGVATQAACAWAATSGVPWITVTAPAGATGPGSVAFTVATNHERAVRTGSVTVAGQAIAITQPATACVFTVTPPATTAFPTAGGTGTVGVATQAACDWAATSSVPWITIPPGATGTGSVAFTVAANAEPVARTGTVSVAGHAVAITQPGTPCVFTLTPSSTTAPETGGTATIQVETHSGCAWEATGTTNPAWIKFRGGFGRGNGRVTVMFAPTTGQPRTGVVTIGNASGNAAVTFAQAGGAVGYLTGTITDNLINRPAADVYVNVKDTYPPYNDWLGGQTDSSGRYSISLPPGTYLLSTGSLNFLQAHGYNVPITAGQTTTFNFSLTPGSLSLPVVWNPSPVSVNPNDPGCGVANRYCWSFTVRIGDNSAGTKITPAHVNTWVVRYYDPYGTLDSAATQTRTGAEFVEQFGATLPASRLRQVTLSHSRGGAIDYVISGVDIVGRPFSFTSPQLVLNPFASTATLTSVPSAPAGGRASDEGPANRR